MNNKSSTINTNNINISKANLGSFINHTIVMFNPDEFN